MTKPSVSPEVDATAPRSEAVAPKSRRSRTPLLVATGLLALAAAYAGWDDETRGRLEVPAPAADVQADSTPAAPVADGMSALALPQSVIEAGKATIAVSLRPSMIPF